VSKVLLHLPRALSRVVLEKRFAKKGLKTDENAMYLYKAPGETIWPHGFSLQLAHAPRDRDGERRAGHPVAETAIARHRHRELTRCGCGFGGRMANACCEMNFKRHARVLTETEPFEWR
jgi:hypothetical protein